MDDTHTGQRIRAMRQERGLTLQQVAADADLSVQSLGEIEAGRSSPRVVTLFAIASALGCDPGALVGTPPEMRELSEDERELLARWRALSEDGRRLLLETARVFPGAMTAAS